MAKTFWAVLLVLLVVGVGGAWWLYNSLDAVLASAIRGYGPQITGVTVKVAAVKIHPAQGQASVRDFEVGNPAGFKTERALEVGQISMVLDVASLTKELVLVKEITIEQPVVTYEYASAGSNLDVIQRNVQSYIEAHSGNKAQPGDAGAPTKLIIEHLYIKGARANVSAEVLQGKAVSVALPDLHMTDIGKKSNGVTPEEATRQIVSALTRNVSKAVVPLNLGRAAEGVKEGLSSATKAIKGLFQ